MLSKHVFKRETIRRFLPSIVFGVEKNNLLKRGIVNIKKLTIPPLAGLPPFVKSPVEPFAGLQVSQVSKPHLE